MGLFDLFKTADINEGVKKMQDTQGAVLLDVRTEEEYFKAHIPGSLNIPLDELQTAVNKIPDKNTPVFVYCLSGSRSRQAEQVLRNMGYTDLTNIGGIHNYNGKTERGTAK
ncbi:rhodanese-like domain-containing protein [Christensenella intestinihominis]|uniref:rhodanese-like domain-containing protein n=1 Tax=Christensenella intestinihominis TaxID=1851429 RepID=UPI0008319687|nr:rhodanese-like domain-containing protein [Christensenella intestinihominis]